MTIRQEAPRRHAGHALSFATELRRQASRRVTWIAVSVMAALPLVILVGLAIGGVPEAAAGPRSQFEDLGSLASSSGLNFATFTVFTSGWMLLAIVFAALFGDAVAGEAKDGTLRYLLAVPVPRGRLLTVKLLVALTYSAGSVVLLVVVALAGGSLRYGWGPLNSSITSAVAPGPAFVRLCAVTGYLVVAMLAVAGVAFLLSVLVDSSVAAAGGALLAYTTSTILDQVAALGAIRNVFPTHYGDAWLGLLTSPVHTDMVLRGTALSLGYAALAFGAAWWCFLRRDVLN
ncbi:ABC transporter permease [Micromonospora zamorensis]|uniref:ABC transporter permease n=1 Tax=Micromonospora zamorensis TaxID=709883 RepID=UPI003D9832AE